MSSAKIKTQNNQWLSQYVFPLWMEKGVDSQNGGFIESIEHNGSPQDVPRRAMVQARQIYAFTEAVKLKILTANQVRPILINNLKFLERYSLPNGSYLHAVDRNGQAIQLQNELYTQAFLLFGLARAFELLKNVEIKERALQLLKYLQTERRAPQGGYTELKNSEVLFQSNPHMHLFEAAIEWMRVDRASPQSSQWKSLATDLSDLCLKQFMNNGPRVVAEYFSESWQPHLEQGRFIFEPGHQFEWAWLFQQYGDLTGQSFQPISEHLFLTAEKYGINTHRQLAFDEMWSDFTVKKSSSRFWPQCERIKIAVELKHELIADQAMLALHQFFAVPQKGLWQDTRDADGIFIPQAAKASSLYHIINAMSEYELKR